jgi:hypothetical protein
LNYFGEPKIDAAKVERAVATPQARLPEMLFFRAETRYAGNGKCAKYGFGYLKYCCCRRR